MALLQKKVMATIVTFFGGFVMKKVTVVMLFYFWSFWSSSLKLKINNEMVVFLNVESCNG